MQMAFLFDQSRCSGCYTCVVACQQWHSAEKEQENWRWITSTEKGEFPNVTVAALSLSCNHCAEPACLAACPSSAISKRSEDGVVVVDQEKCLGKDTCGMMCKVACPYSAPQFGVEADAKMQMCNFCLDRLGEGKKPICVAACPLRALDSGPLEKMGAGTGKINEAEGFSYSPKLRPSIVFKPK